MSEMQPELRRQLVEAIAQAFGPDDLAMLVRLTLGTRLDLLVAPGKPTDYVVFQMLESAERRGELPVLLRGVVEARPKVPSLVALVTDNFPAALQEQPAAGLVADVKAGLVTLVDRMADPQVRMWVGRFQADFDAVRDQVTKLKGYKGLHDSLHNLQLKLPAVAAEAERFAQNPPGGGALLKNYARELRREAQNARASLAELPSSPLDDDWVTNFERATVGLSTAVDGRDAAAVASELEVMLGFLGESPRINALLSEAAASMRLDKLIDALAEISGHLATGSGGGTAAGGGNGGGGSGGGDGGAAGVAPAAGAGGNRASLGNLRSALDGLKLLRPRLAGLVVEHYEWQWLQKELALGERPRSQQPDKRVPQWAQAKLRLTRLCEVYPAEQWSVELRELMPRWEAAGTAAAAAAAAAAPGDGAAAAISAADAAFGDFRHVGILRFFDVDVELNELCKQLAEVARPLDDLLDIIAPQG